MRTLSMILLVIFAAGVCFAQTGPADVAKQFTPKKVEVDRNFDGKVDRVEYYDQTGQIMKVEEDNAGKGVFNETIIYKNGVPVKKEKDTNFDGKPDVFVSY